MVCNVSLKLFGVPDTRDMLPSYLPQASTGCSQETKRESQWCWHVGDDQLLLRDKHRAHPKPFFQGHKSLKLLDIQAANLLIPMAQVKIHCYWNRG